MSEIKKMIERLCPNGVEFKKLGDVANCYSGATPKTGVASYWENGTIFWMNSGEVNLGRVYQTANKITQAGYDSCSTKMVPPHTVLIALAGQGKTRGTVAITEIELCTNQSLCAVAVDPEIVNSYFLWHYLRGQYQTLRKISSGDGTRGGLNQNMIRNFEIPVPPIEVQSKIVELLDNFTELEAEMEAKLEAELEARRKQYEYYRNQLLTFDLPDGKAGKDKGARFDVKWMKLGEIGEVCMCKRIMKHQTSDSGEIPFFKIGTFGGTPDAFIDRDLYEEYKSKFSYPKKGDILISASGTIGRAVIFDGKDAYFQDSNIVWIDNNESILYNKYLYYLYSIIDWKTEGGTIKRLYNGNLKATKIAVPPLSEQERIVSILDRFEALTTDLQSGLPAEIEARRKQYEYYREKLLTFKRKSA